MAARKYLDPETNTLCVGDDGGVTESDMVFTRVDEDHLVVTCPSVTGHFQLQTRVFGDIESAKRRLIDACQLQCTFRNRDACLPSASTHTAS